LGKPSAAADNRASSVIAVASVLAILALVHLSLRAGASPEPEKLIGPDTCGECHEKEVEAWKTTRHSLGFDDLHKNERAKEIQGKLGIRRLKTAEACIGCHYTMGTERGRLRAVAGVSCESCHGAARDWVKIHDDYGHGNTRATEPAEHRQKRRADCETAGMSWPGQVSGLATHCFECHIVTDPELVEKGGHPAASDFELVAWTQGEIRHNFFESDGKENRESAPARKRRMFVVGQGLDLAASLSALSKAKADGEFASAMLARIEGARARLTEIGKLVTIPEIEEMLSSCAGITATSWKDGGADPICAASEAVRQAIDEFAGREDGSTLGALDPLVPATGAYRGAPALR